MKKIVFSVFALAGGVSAVSAQSLDDGKMALYYEKFTSATQILQQVVQKDPKNAEAAYWLGQVYLDNQNESNGIQKATQLYQQTANAVGPNPWILVGLGQIDYINKNTAAAEQKFEQALPLSDKLKGKKDINKAAIYTAIGRASAFGDKDLGDPSYAIPALQQAANLDKTAPEPDIYLGLNFLKLGGDMGGNAYTAFNDAATRNPKYAAAFFHMGRIFQAQDNTEVMDTWYNKGVEADPNYGPIYAAYFDYYKDKDVNKAKTYLDKYVAVSDKGCDVQYFQAEYSFESGKYQESLQQAKQMESGSCASYAHLPLLIAMDYHRLGDNANATTYAKKYFSTATPSTISADDYAFGGYILMNDSATAGDAVSYLQKAYAMDTMPDARATYADSISYALDKANQPQQKYNWDRYVYSTKDTGSNGYNLAIFHVGSDALALAGTDPKYYATADTFFTKYKTRYPDQIYGYKYLAQSKIAQGDTIAATPYVDDYFNQFVKALAKDSTMDKLDILEKVGSLAGFYVNSKADYPTGLKYLNETLQLDPTNSDAKQNADAIQAYLDKKNKSSSGSSGSGTKKH